jgi:hypothetical protein
VSSKPGTVRTTVALPATNVPAPVRIAFAKRRFAKQPRKAFQIPKLTLWVSAARGGGWCEGLQRSAVRFDRRQVSCRWADQRYGPIAATWSIQLFWGRASMSAVKTLKLEFKDGRALTIPLKDGFFLFRVPDEVLAQGGPSALVAYNGKGAEIGRQEVGFRLSPSIAFAGIQRPPGGARLARKRRAIARPTAAGRAVIWTAPSGLRPAQCYWLTLERAVYGGGCRHNVPAPRSLWEVVPLRFNAHGRTVEILWGQVGDDVASLRLRFQDGKQEQLAIEHGFYLYPVPPGHYAVGRRPAFLIASAANGRTLSKHLLVEYTAN